MARSSHRRFGSVRQRASGRWQARYRGPDGRMRSPEYTFETKRDAERYLTMIEAAIRRDEWTDPARAKVRLNDYAGHWIAERPGLRPRTVQLYRWTLAKHITPYIGEVPLGRLDPPLIRRWRGQLLFDGVSPGMVAKAYRLLRAVLMTAVNEDRILSRNPCRVPGADKESPAERPVLTLDQVGQLMNAVPRRYRALILVAAIGGLRFGEITALEREDVEFDSSSIRVRQQFLEVKGRGLTLGPPKSRAGVRTVAMPPTVMKLLGDHMAEYVVRERAALVFTTSSGAPIRRGSFNKLANWGDAVASIGMPGLHFHDLRHTGNMLAAASRVSTRDLMARMGHDSMTAALIYQHATREADRAVADHLETGLAERLKPETDA
jgi:integrase